MNSDAKKNCTWIQTVYVYVLSQCRKIIFRTVICFIFPFPFFHFESLLRVLGVLGLKNHVELFLFPRFSAGAQRTVPYAQVTKSTTSGCGSAVNFDDVKAKVIFNKRTDYFFLRYKVSKMAKCWE